ncbi:hypothetical protein BON254_03510 [Helicobacter pylori]
MKKDRKKKQKYSNITDATIMGSTSEESALYASANREHLSVLDKLEEISKRKINPNYIKQNINQQAGYSAEIKEQARVNEHNILKDYYRDIQKVAHLEEKRQYCKTIKAHTRPARVAKGEAIEARLNPKLSAAKDVANLSHQAGMNAIAKGRALSYGSAFASSSLGGWMQSSANKVI